MTNTNYELVVYSKNVIEFVTVANEYCLFIENNSQYNRFDYIDRLQKMLPLLYLKASLLPTIDENDVEVPEKFVTEVDYNYILNKLTAKFGQFDSYQEVFVEGMQFSENAIESSIAENICDIYQDLKDFLLCFRIGTVEIMTDALFECKQSFSSYWGQKLVNGLRAIHSLRYGDYDLTEDEANKTKINENNTDWVAKHFDNYFENED